MKTKLRKTDRLFRQYILRFYNYTCARCHTRYAPDNCRGLHVSHYWSRSRENTRFDIENVSLLCYGCHIAWGHGDQRDEYTDHMRTKLGERRFEMLRARAHTYKRRDDKLDEVAIKEMLKELEKTDGKIR